MTNNNGPKKTVPIQLTINIVRTLLTCLVRALPLRPFLACALIRTFLYTFTPRQLQLLTPSTLATYKRFIRDARARARQAGDFKLLEQLREDVEVLPDGASRLLWIGDRSKATRFVYFLHGGGYMVPATRGHLQWCLQSYVQHGQQEKVAVAVLQYTLTPAARFPTQMCQAAAGLRHLLVEHKIRPGQVVVGGDSAGGNLTIQLLTHLLHPYPAADVAGGNVTIGGEEPLAGAFLVSPFTSGNTNTRSFRDGKPCDMLSLGIFDQPKREMFHEPSSGSSPRGLLGGHFFPPRGSSMMVETKEFREGRKWALPADADDEKWLDGMDRVVKKVYVTCGRHEILRDQGIEMAEAIRRRNSGVDVRLEVADKEAHDFMLLEGERRLVGDATARMRAWFRTVWA